MVDKFLYLSIYLKYQKGQRLKNEKLVGKI